MAYYFEAAQPEMDLTSSLKCTDCNDPRAFGALLDSENRQLLPPHTVPDFPPAPIFGSSNFSPTWSGHESRNHSDTLSRRSPPSQTSSSISSWDDWPANVNQFRDPVSGDSAPRLDFNFASMTNDANMGYDWYYTMSLATPITQSPLERTPSLERADEQLTCPEGCEKVTFGRKYDRARHINEQHRCPYKGCEGQKFSPDARREHMKVHNERGFGYDCGSCILLGLSVKPFPRPDKLKKHFKEIHSTTDEFRYGEFQCRDPGCYAGKSCGGIYFTSAEELKAHFRSEHCIESPPGQELKLQESGPDAALSLGESISAGNIGKHHLDSASDSLAKRAKSWANPSNSPTRRAEITAYPKDIMNFGNTKRTSPHSSVLKPTNDRISDGDQSSVLPVLEDTLPFSMFELPSLNRRPDFQNLLKMLRMRQISALFDAENDTIVLRGACPREKLDVVKKALGILAGKVRPENIWEYPHTEGPSDSPYRTSIRRHLDPSGHAQIFAIRPVEDATAVKTWRNLLLPRFPSLVKDLPVGDNYSVALVRQAGKRGIPFPTIRFCSSAGQSDITRKKIRNRCNLLCDQNGRPPIHIYFSEGATVRLVGGGISDIEDGSPSNDVKPFPHHRRPWDKPGMGASIGMSTCRHQSATSGGHIVIDDEPYMLSVDHFIYPEPKCACTNQTVKLSSPSLLDLNYLRSHVKTKMGELKLKRKDELITQWNQATPGPVPLEDAAEQLVQGETMEELKLFERFAEELNKPDSDFELGTLTYKCTRHSVRESGTGRWQTPDSDKTLHRMDWSLTEINPKRQGFNMHRHKRIHELQLKDFQNEIHTPEGAGVPCETTVDFIGDEKVHYVGQASGLREGRINPEPVLLVAKDKITHECSIIIDSPERRDPSCFEGDSGAFILDNENRLVGLLWAWEQEFLLFTPIHDIFDDIRATIPRGHEKKIDLFRDDHEDELGIHNLSRKHVDSLDEASPRPQQQPKPQVPSIEQKKAKLRMELTVESVPTTRGPVSPTAPSKETSTIPPSPVPSLASSISSEPTTPTPPSPTLQRRSALIEISTLTTKPRLPTIKTLCLPEDIEIALSGAQKLENPKGLQSCASEGLLEKGSKFTSNTNLKAVRTW